MLEQPATPPEVVEPSLGCPSTRGRWGEPCPDCGKVLPAPRKLTSWHAARDVSVPFGTVSGRVWSGRQREAHRKRTGRWNQKAANA